MNQIVPTTHHGLSLSFNSVITTNPSSSTSKTSVRNQIEAGSNNEKLGIQKGQVASNTGFKGQRKSQRKKIQIEGWRITLSSEY